MSATGMPSSTHAKRWPASWRTTASRRSGRSEGGEQRHAGRKRGGAQPVDKGVGAQRDPQAPGEQGERSHEQVEVCELVKGCGGEGRCTRTRCTHRDESLDSQACELCKTSRAHIARIQRQACRAEDVELTTLLQLIEGIDEWLAVALSGHGAACAAAAAAPSRWHRLSSQASRASVRGLERITVVPNEKESRTPRAGGNPAREFQLTVLRRGCPTRCCLAREGVNGTTRQKTLGPTIIYPTSLHCPPPPQLRPRRTRLCCRRAMSALVEWLVCFLFDVLHHLHHLLARGRQSVELQQPHQRFDQHVHSRRRGLRSRLGRHRSVRSARLRLHLRLRLRALRSAKARHLKARHLGGRAERDNARRTRRSRHSRRRRCRRAFWHAGPHRRRRRRRLRCEVRGLCLVLLRPVLLRLVPLELAEERVGRGALEARRQKGAGQRALRRAVNVARAAACAAARAAERGRRVRLGLRLGIVLVVDHRCRRRRRRGRQVGEHQVGGGGAGWRGARIRSGRGQPGCRHRSRGGEGHVDLRPRAGTAMHGAAPRRRRGRGQCGGRG
eukprot:scaffold39105_cov76-Phaeocystis_antarctica.AAC.11